MVLFTVLPRTQQRLLRSRGSSGDEKKDSTVLGARSVLSWQPQKAWVSRGSHLPAGPWWARRVLGDQTRPPFSQHRHLRGPVPSAQSPPEGRGSPPPAAPREGCLPSGLGPGEACSALLPSAGRHNLGSICLHGITGTGQDGEAAFRQEGSEVAIDLGEVRGGRGEEVGRGRPRPSLLGSSPALPLTRCVVSGNSLPLSGPQFPHLSNEEVRLHLRGPPSSLFLGFSEPCLRWSQWLGSQGVPGSCAEGLPGRAGDPGQAEETGRTRGPRGGKGRAPSRGS